MTNPAQKKLVASMVVLRNLDRLLWKLNKFILAQAAQHVLDIQKRLPEKMML